MYESCISGMDNRQWLQPATGQTKEKWCKLCSKRWSSKERPESPRVSIHKYTGVRVNKREKVCDTVKTYIKGVGCWITGNEWEYVAAIKIQKEEQGIEECQVREVVCFHITGKRLEREWLSYQKRNLSLLCFSELIRKQKKNIFAVSKIQVLRIQEEASSQLMHNRGCVMMTTDLKSI